MLYWKKINAKKRCKYKYHLENMILILLLRCTVKAPAEYCVQLWTSDFKTDINQQENLLSQANKTIRSLKRWGQFGSINSVNLVQRKKKMWGVAVFSKLSENILKSYLIKKQDSFNVHYKQDNWVSLKEFRWHTQKTFVSKTWQTRVCQALKLPGQFCNLHCQRSERGFRFCGFCFRA